MNKKKQDQPKLFDDAPQEQKIRSDFPITHGAARHTDPKTSKVAAAEVNAGDLEVVFLCCLYRHGNKTSEEVAKVTGCPLNSISPRTAPLIRKELIVDSGERRPGASGKKQIVWAMTDLGREIVIRSLKKGND